MAQVCVCTVTDRFASIRAKACACNVDLAAKLKQLASQFSENDRRKLAAYAAAQNIAEHPVPIRTADGVRAV